MRILHTADWHLGKKLDYYSRLPEQKEVLQEIIGIAREKAVDLVIVAGDLFDNFTPSNAAATLLYETLSELGNHGKVPVIAIAGNHDSPERINVPDVFARRNGIIFIGNPTDVVPTFAIEGGFELTKTEAGFIAIQLPEYEYPVRILHTAFANERRMKEYFGEDKRNSLQESLTQKWQDLAKKYCDKSGVNLLTTHLFMQKRSGQKLIEPEGEKPLNIGNADVVYSDAIPAEIQYVALGHLHNCHNVGTNQPVIYSSSPLAYSFAESGKQKQVCVVDLEPGGIPKIERIPLRKGKELKRKMFTRVTEAVKWLEENPDCLIELTLQTDTFLTAEEQQQIQQAHSGIIYIIPQIKNAKTEVQNGNTIDLKKSMPELFADYFKTQKDGQEPNDELMDLFNEILNAHVTD